MSQRDDTMVARVGVISSILAATLALAAFAIAVTTAPARSGPNCLAEPCVTYPFTSVAKFVPTEYVWMYPAALMVPVFVGAILALHYSIRGERRIFTHAALFFAFMSAASLGVDYLIQFVAVEPSLVKGELGALSLWSQYNPHGIFIALEDYGYLTLGLSFLFIGLGLGRRNGLLRAIRILLVVAGVFAVGALIVLALLLGSNLEYQYEVAAIVIDWTTLISVGVLLAVHFARMPGVGTADDAS